MCLVHLAQVKHVKLIWGWCERKQRLNLDANGLTNRPWRGSLAEKANAIRQKSDLEQRGLGTVEVNQEQ